MKINLHITDGYVLACPESTTTYKMPGGDYVSGYAYKIRSSLDEAISMAIKETPVLMNRTYYQKALVPTKNLEIVAVFDKTKSTLVSKSTKYKKIIKRVSDLVKEKRTSNVFSFEGGYAGIRG